MALQPDVLIVHYDEIGLKRGNRARFEELLRRNVRSLSGGALSSLRREYGYLVGALTPGVDLAVLRRRLPCVPGIANLTLAVATDLDLQEMERAAVELAGQRTYETFKIDTRRPNKLFPYNSIEVNRRLGAAVLEQVGGKVRLNEPDLTIYVEIGFRQAYVSVERIRGVGGLPVGAAGKLVALVSGGIDSPVAAFKMMQRGARVVIVHFQNETQVQADVEDKVADLTRVLAQFQGPTRLYVVPFADLQMQIIASVPASLRMIIYRRFMLRIAAAIARRERAKGLIVGDTLSQVASQTLSNLNVTYDAAGMNVYAPLMGFNKNETVEWAKRIGTYEISIRPYADCCTFFVAPHPETNANRRMIETVESHLDVRALTQNALRQARKTVVEP